MKIIQSKRRRADKPGRTYFDVVWTYGPKTDKGRRRLWYIQSRGPRSLGGLETYVTYPSQRAAFKRAKELAKTAEPSEVLIHDLKNAIRARSTYPRSSDPRGRG